MEGKIQHWHKRIDAVTTSMLELASGMQPDELNFKPSATVWSLAQIMDHLIKINGTYFPILDQLKAGKYKPSFWGRFGFLARMGGKFILKSVRPENKKNIKTFAIWEPAKSDLPAGIVDHFRAHQEILKDRIKASQHLLKQNPIINSPASNKIAYHLETAFEIIVTHEERHLLHASNMVKNMRASA